MYVFRMNQETLASKTSGMGIDPIQIVSAAVPRVGKSWHGAPTSCEKYAQHENEQEQRGKPFGPFDGTTLEPPGDVDLPAPTHSGQDSGSRSIAFVHLGAARARRRRLSHNIRSLPSASQADGARPSASKGSVRCEPVCFFSSLSHPIHVVEHGQLGCTKHTSVNDLLEVISDSQRSRCAIRGNSGFVIHLGPTLCGPTTLVL